MHDAVHEMYIVLVDIVGGHDRHDGFERGWSAHCHLDRVESAPGDAEHADIAAGERLLRQPVDHDFSVALLLLGVFVFNQTALAAPGAADIDPRNDIAVPDEVGEIRKASATTLVLAVGQVLEQHRKFFGADIGRQVEVGGKTHAIGQGDPGFVDCDALMLERRCREEIAVDQQYQGQQEVFRDPHMASARPAIRSLPQAP